MPTVELEIPARSAYVGVVRLAVASLARAAGFDEEAVDDLRIAVSEACANSVIAHESASTDDPVTVTWRDFGDRVEVDVADRGIAPEGSDDDFRMSLSAGLMESLVDGCAIDARDGGGTLTRLILRRR